MLSGNCAGASSTGTKVEFPFHWVDNCIDFIGKCNTNARGCDMPLSSRLTSKCQVTVPKEIRKALRLSPGNLVHFAIEGGKAVLRPAPESHAKALKGLGKDSWRSLGGADRFLRRERDSWA